MMDQLKDVRHARALDKKNLAKLSPDKRKRLMEHKETKQVGYFRMPDAPEPKKGKTKDTRIWSPCPLLEGVPPVPPPRVPQPWELKFSHEIIKTEEEDDVIEGTPPKIIIPQNLIARVNKSGGTPPQTAPESESEPPAGTPPQKKRCLDQFDPSTGIVQSAVPPQNPVFAEIELLGFTPSSTTSPFTLDAEEDIERDRNFGEGSDVEPEDDEAALNRSNVEVEVVDVDNLPDPNLAMSLQNIDAEADSALRAVLLSEPDGDLLHFDWRREPENFEGVRETFSVPCTGPTFQTQELTPVDIFLKIWDTDIIAHIVRETNRYGGEMQKRSQKPHARLNRWKDVTETDIKTFFAIMMLQSLVINNVEREYWYPKLEELQIGNFKAIMPYNRFLIIKRCLHFVNNASLPEHPNRLHKIMPIIEHLNKKFSSLYVLEQNVAIDESLLLWKGRLSFSQKIATKKARVGIKSYELCESRTGYLWRMEVYSGKGHVHVAQLAEQGPVVEHEAGDEPEGATSQIVLSLIKPITNRGHTLVMDNFYNAPLLSRILKVKQKTDTMGTLRLNREFVPEGLKKKTKTNMREGEVAFSTTKDLCVIAWMDKNLVTAISTYHPMQVGGIEKYGYYRYRPQLILDYNRSMGGIDHKDQMLHAYPIERTRNIAWYKKLFRRLVNVSIHNSLVMFNHNRTQVIGNRDFRLQLAKELLQLYRPRKVPRPLQPPASTPSGLSQMHLPAKNERPQRCKLCYAAKVRRTTMWSCSTCSVNLCIEGCYTSYHQQKRRED